MSSKALATEDSNKDMYYVYILQSENSDQIYAGRTTDLDRRLVDHNSGKSRHTKKFRPWKLIYYSAFSSQQKAEEFERYLKTGSGIAFARRHLL